MSLTSLKPIHTIANYAGLHERSAYPSATERELQTVSPLSAKRGWAPHHCAVCKCLSCCHGQRRSITPRRHRNKYAENFALRRRLRSMRQASMAYQALSRALREGYWRQMPCHRCSRYTTITSNSPGSASLSSVSRHRPMTAASL